MQLGGGGWIGKKKDRKKEIAENKNPEQLPGRDQLVLNDFTVGQNITDQLL
jgi:hypothetical protein